MVWKTLIRRQVACQDGPVSCLCPAQLSASNFLLFSLFTCFLFSSSLASISFPFPSLRLLSLSFPSSFCLSVSVSFYSSLCLHYLPWVKLSSLAVFLPYLPSSWDYRQVPPCPADFNFYCTHSRLSPTFSSLSTAAVLWVWFKCAYPKLHVLGAWPQWMAEEVVGPSWVGPKGRPLDHLGPCSCGVKIILMKP